MADIQQLIETIKGMTVLELSEFVKALQEEFGVTAAVPVAAAGPAAGGAAEAAPEVEEKTSFDVILTDVGGNRIQVIKVVRELTGLGLKEAKEVVEGAPKPVLEGVNKEAADAARAKLEEQGAKAEIK
ncbi:MAG: 50S ribosomal protein L7/L12 [Armatimonadetes bacterium]|nr:50S ribosomal protein L7/L12 [Armatimonadota bacterium]